MKSIPAGQSPPLPQPTMAIGALAARFGLPTHVLRHWESMGLLTPARDGGGRRRYGRPDVVRVAVIMLAKDAGLPLERIRELLATQDPAARRAAMLRHRDGLRRRVAEAQAALGLIEGALDCEHADLAACPHFREAVAQRVDGRRQPRNHPHEPTFESSS